MESKTININSYTGLPMNSITEESTLIKKELKGYKENFDKFAKEENARYKELYLQYIKMDDTLLKFEERFEKFKSSIIKVLFLLGGFDILLLYYIYMTVRLFNLIG